MERGKGGKPLILTFLRFVIPSIISMWIFAFYTIVDGFFVARGVGPVALAAVNLSIPFNNFVFAAGLLFATGTSTVISFALGRGLWGLLVGIAATHWTSLARLIRGEVMQLRSQQYIAVSRKLGKSSGWILTHHLLPHLVPQFIVGLILMFPHAILHEASISFLGYGLPPEQPAIGIILSESMQYLSTGMWWPAVFPGAVLVGIVLLVDRLGENLRMILDPYSAQE